MYRGHHEPESITVVYIYLSLYHYHYCYSFFSLLLPYHLVKFYTTSIFVRLIIILVTTIIVIHNTAPSALHSDGACHVQPSPFRD